MIQPKKNLYKVYNQRLAGWLMQSGFPIIALVEENERKRSFVFCDTPELHSAIKCRHEEIQNHQNIIQTKYDSEQK